MSTINSSRQPERSSSEMPKKEMSKKSSKQLSSQVKSQQVIDLSGRFKKSPVPISDEVRYEIAERELAKAKEIKLRSNHQRLQVCGVEAVANISVNLLVGAMSIVTLVNLVPQCIEQFKLVNSITAETNALEAKVAALREQLPTMFDAGKSQINQHKQQGWVKPNQIPLKLDEPATSGSASGVLPPSNSGNANR